MTEITATIANQSGPEFSTACEVAVNIGRALLESTTTIERRDLLARAALNLDLIGATAPSIETETTPLATPAAAPYPKPFLETVIEELRDSDIWGGKFTETQKVIKTLQIFAADKELAAATQDTRLPEQKGVDYYSSQLRRSILLRGISARRRTATTTRTRINYPAHV